MAVLAACGGDDGPPAGAAASLGDPEGALDLVVAPGYAEDVTGFEDATGCRVNATVADTPERTSELLRSGEFDGGAVSGVAALGLIDQGAVDPVNTDLVPNYEDVFPALQDASHYTVDDVPYGVPVGRAVTLLMTDPKVVPKSIVITDDDVPSWAPVFDPEVASAYRGRLTAYGAPIYIADAAIYLRDHRKELGIDDPYELDQEQFDAAIELLREQRPNIGRYWLRPAQEAEDFAAGRSVGGSAWKRAAQLTVARGKAVNTEVPEEGATGWSDTWMLSAGASHPNCMYLWMDHALSPEANAAVAERTGQAPANERACDLTRKANHCDVFNAADEDLFDEVDLWQTPMRDCGDDRGEECVPYEEWARAFAEVVGAPPEDSSAN